MYEYSVLALRLRISSASVQTDDFLIKRLLQTNVNIHVLWEWLHYNGQLHTHMHQKGVRFCCGRQQRLPRKLQQVSAAALLVVLRLHDDVVSYVRMYPM